MAKKALLDVLEKTIGKYVCNLDTNSLNVAVWSGKIELHSLELNVGAVNAELDRQAAQAPNLAVPLRVVDGHFSSFEVDVPWAYLMSKPVILRAKGLKVSVAPVDPHTSELLAKSSEEKAADRVRSARLQSIATANDYRIQKNALTKLAEEDVKGDGKNVKDTGFVARLVRRIIENLQVEISDVHVTLQGAEASAGVVLDSLRLITTDEAGNQAFVDRTTDSNKSFLYKSLVLSGMGAYLDEKSTVWNKALEAIGEDDEDADDEKGTEHRYILAPLSFTARLRQADGNVCIDYPKYLLESELKSLSILLSKTQVELAKKIQKQIQPGMDGQRPLFPEYRPIGKVTKETAREWWKYAYRCVGRLNGRRSWAELFRAFQIRNEYIDLYRRNTYQTECSWVKPLSGKESARLKEIEEDRSISVDGLMIWRNIADARAKMEIEKNDSRQKPKASLFGSLFSKPDPKKSTEDDFPVALSPDEMKELENLTLKDVGADNDQLSKESKLCDLNFVLGSFTVHLTTHDMLPLSTLEMGKVATTWKANADGSFLYDLTLRSLTIEDRITPHTLFPSILSNQQGDDKEADRDQAFVVVLEKTKMGDQKLLVKLRPFEIVASPILVQELIKFSSAGSVSGPPQTLKAANPMLRQSLTGSVDLFYDAAEGVDLSSPEAKSKEKAHASNQGTDLSGAIFDAWKAKAESNTVWILDLNLAAPVIVVPENCSKPNANILVVNLGRLAFRYGDIGASTRVRDFFSQNPYPDKTVEAQHDYGSLQIISLTFVVGKASDWKELVRADDCVDTNRVRADPVLAPITASMDFGVENHSTQPRVAAFLVLPLVAGGISAPTLARILKVSEAWQKVLTSLSSSDGRTNDEEEHDDALSQVTTESTSSMRASMAARRAKELLLSLEKSDSVKFPVLHFDMQLKQMSAEVTVENGGCVEAHLVSVSSSVTTFSDRSAEVRLSMGWFWILDRLENNFPRVQRLVAHSSLPVPACTFAEKGYDVLGELKARGVFDNSFQGSSDLAAIIVRLSPGRKFGSKNPFVEEVFDGDDFAVDIILDATFTSFYVNWNPYAVKTLVSQLESFNQLLQSIIDGERDSAIISSGAIPRKQGVSTLAGGPDSDAYSDSCLLVRAELQGVEFMLRSALDDLPLFALSMTESKMAVSLASGQEKGMKFGLQVGNLQAVSSDLGCTCSSYRTIIGVSPGKIESLLTVSYFDGPRAMGEVQGKEGIEAFGLLHFSPIRVVYIQSQIITLVNYTTEGILGAITMQAASSAAAAAAEITNVSAGKKQFVVEATGFEVLVPEAAYMEKVFSTGARNLSVSYEIMPFPGGGEAKVTLDGMMLLGNSGEPMLESSSGIHIEVILPPGDVGSVDDQAMRVQVHLGDANFNVTKAQYRQLIMMLDQNIGDAKLYLRPGDELAVTEEVPSPESGDTVPTHIGNMVVENPRRIYTVVTMSRLSLSLFWSDRQDPLIRMTTDETRITSDLLPNGEKNSTTISMKNLECFDERSKAIGREYRSLIYQGENDRPAAPAGVIWLHLETRKDRETILKVSVGTPRMVFIPDAVSEALQFFSSDGGENSRGAMSVKDSMVITDQRAHVEIEDNNPDSEIEAEYIVGQSTNERVSRYSLSFVTSDCYFIFVDLGSTSLLESAQLKTSMVQPMTETFVVKGVLDCRLDLQLNNQNEVVFANAEFHGDGFEAYTAFGGSNDAQQVLEPAKLSLYANAKTLGDKTRVVDVRVASVTSLDFCLSMKNVALLGAISSGITDCFTYVDKNDSHPLAAEMSQKEAENIIKLSTALQDDDESMEASSSRATSFAEAEESSNKSSKLTVSAKLTLPEFKITFVNDLQGLDDALVRVAIQNLVANGFVETGTFDHRLKKPFTSFSANTNCSITSDYFDDANRLWNQLLLKPWEITLRAQRGMNSKLSARIPSTTCDIESFACQMGFTEQFLMSLASANRMWTIYSTAISSVTEHASQNPESDSLRRIMAASAARAFVSVLPYAIENHCGRDIQFVVHGGREAKSTCVNKTMEYFRFPQPKGEGSGGRRLYGQDRTSKNSLTIFVADFPINLPDIDSIISSGRESHVLPSQEVIFVNVIKEGKAIAIHVSSSVEIVNKCSMPFSVSVVTPKKTSRASASERTDFIGTSRSRFAKSTRKSSHVRRDGRMTKESICLGVPVENLKHFNAEWSSLQQCVLNLSVCPELEGMNETERPVGGINVDLKRRMFSDDDMCISSAFDVSCRPPSEESGTIDTFVIQVKVVASLVGGWPHIEIDIAPRALIQNSVPLSMSVRTPMPHTFSEHSSRYGESYDIHHLAQDDVVEVFTPGPSIAVSLRCTDNPVAGNPTDWMEGGWVDLPLQQEFRLPEPFFVYLPFPTISNERLSRRGGTEVVIADKLSPHWDQSALENEGKSEGMEVSTVPEKEDWRKYIIGVSQYAVDHTGEVLFEDGSSEGHSQSTRSSVRRSHLSPSHSLENNSMLTPLGAYRSERHHGRITLLPAKKKIRLVHLTMEGEAGYVKSAPFLFEDVALCEGGAEATSIPWESGEPTGFFAYRRVTNLYQSEIHIIPEYVVYNGSKTHKVRVKQPGMGEVTVHPGKIAPLRSQGRTRVAISVEYEGFGARTAPMNVDTAALRFAVARAYEGYPIGSVAIETVVGTQDSRWVVKLSDLKLGASQVLKPKEHSIFENDLLRFRIQWTELKISLSEARPASKVSEEIHNMNMAQPRSSTSHIYSKRPELLGGTAARQIQQDLLSDLRGPSEPVCSILFYRFTVDWQRVFKEEQCDATSNVQNIGRAKASPERSQISVIVHNVQIRDESEGSKYPIVFDSTTDTSFFDLCLRTRGPLSAEMINVNLFDLKLSCSTDRPRPIVIKVYEDFIWKLLDLAHQISEAASEVGGHQIDLFYDEEHEGYVVSVSDHKASFIEDETKYTPPSSTTLYDFEKVRVSPVLLVVSFDRTPQKSRYKKRRHIRGAHLVNYFTRQLKFKIDQAELWFGAFGASNIKGGSDRLIELLSTAYTSRLKFKVLTFLTATSFQDWKNLASRQEGDDEYLEGDIMRVTGNLAGRSASYILNKAGMGLGGGISLATSKLGDGFESAAGIVGARGFGTGVNNVVSGVGEGFGHTLTGLGSGAGKVFRGTGQGVGQVFGGVGGGVVQLGKGIGKGLQGDSSAFRAGMKEGVSTMGRGVGDGVGAVVGGAADGVTTLGKGVVSGFKSIGKGFGSAITGKPKKKDRNDD